ncbi:MAG TPA: dipeptide epimerase [Steroidobacter sp.]
MSTHPHGRVDFAVSVALESWPLKVPFQITGHTFTEITTVVVTLRDGDIVGRGEAAGVYYRGDVPASIAAQIEAVRDRVRPGMDQESLRRLLPWSGARNAIDCAFWELESRRAGRPVWQLAGLDSPRPLLTTYTLGADEPARMAELARSFADARALKLKLTGELVDAERVRAVRDARPEVWLAVDANQGFTRASLDKLMPVLVESRVELIEQPFPVGQEVALSALASPIPIAADESVQDLEDLRRLAGCMNVVNIKLDKCGGLTSGLAIAREARQLGLKVMVGNMGGTSLAMAPAFILGQLCDVVDLDGPILLASDRTPVVTYRNGEIFCAPDVWGHA